MEERKLRKVFIDWRTEIHGFDIKCIKYISGRVSGIIDACTDGSFSPWFDTYDKDGKNHVGRYAKFSATNEELDKIKKLIFVTEKHKEIVFIFDEVKDEN